MSAATEVFRLPELCAIIFDYLSNEEIYRLQNLSHGSRGFLSDSKSWKQRVMHHAVYTGETIVPKLHKARDGDDDPKKVDWVYTSGESEGTTVTDVAPRRPWPTFSVEPETMTPGYIRAGSDLPHRLRRTSPAPDAMSSSTSALGRRFDQRIQAQQAATTPSSSATASFGGLPSTTDRVEAVAAAINSAVGNLEPKGTSAATPSAIPSSTTTTAGITSPGTPTGILSSAIPSSVATSSTAQATVAPIAQAYAPYTPQSGRRTRNPAYSTNQTQMQGVIVNWVLEAKFPRWKYYPISNMLGLEQEVPMDEFFVTTDALYRPLFLMYPPLSEVMVMDWRSRMFEVSNKSGVTMGDVVDALMKGEAESSEGGGSN